MSADDPGGWSLHLLGAWQLRRREGAVVVGRREQRLIACLGLLGGRPRTLLSGILWPDSNAVHAAGNMRSALWCICHRCPSLLEATADCVALNPAVRVDVMELSHRIERLREDATAAVPAGLTAELAGADLLPGWCDDWLIPEQDGARETRLDALELVAARHLAADKPARAVAAALVAVRVEPLRETAQLLLVRAHLEAGNRASALRAYTHFAALLERELGVAPSAAMRTLVAGIRGQGRAGPE